MVTHICHLKTPTWEWEAQGFKANISYNSFKASFTAEKPV